ncbi:hypothetical protein AB1Y20_021398 [Prymnesium parvum]|uniref:Ubiquitin-like domain-containing protein n=1 Tax=Prymnesium parvum TaxID=97485 RepID=A0AB34JL44_PRYPA
MAGDPAAAKKARAALLLETLERLRVRCPEAARPDDLEDYCRFLTLKVAAKDWYASLLSPPLVVDKIWHAHLLDTLAYEEACAAMGVPRDVRILHHDPNGAVDAVARAARQQRALAHYSACWGPPPGGNWGDDRHGAAKRSAPAAASPEDRRRSPRSRITEPAQISLKAVTLEGEEQLFMCKTNTQFAQLFTIICRHFQLDPKEIQVLYEGSRLIPYLTPQDYDMEDGDIIDIMMQQTGC